MKASSIRNLNTTTKMSASTQTISGKKSVNSSAVNTPASTPVTNGNPQGITQSTPPPPNNNAPKYGTLVPNRIFVGGISANTTEGELLQLFSTYGTVKAAKIIQDRAGVSKGYGFITFESEDDAKRPLRDADNIVLKERRLNIAPAIKKQSFSRTFDASSPPTVAAGNHAQYFFPPGAGVPYFQGGVAYYHQPAPPAPGDPNTQPATVYQAPPVYPAQTGPPQAPTYHSMMFPTQTIYMPQQYPMPMPYDFNYYGGNGGPQYMVGGGGGGGQNGPAQPTTMPSSNASPRPPPCYNPAQLHYGPDPLFYNLSVFGGPLDGPPVYPDGLEPPHNGYNEGPFPAMANGSSPSTQSLVDQMNGGIDVQQSQLDHRSPPYVANAPDHQSSNPQYPPPPPPPQQQSSSNQILSLPQQQPPPPSSSSSQLAQQQQIAQAHQSLMESAHQQHHQYNPNRQSTNNNNTPVVSLLSIEKQQEKDFSSMKRGGRRSKPPLLNNNNSSNNNNNSNSHSYYYANGYQQNHHHHPNGGYYVPMNSQAQYVRRPMRTATQQRRSFDHSSRSSLRTDSNSSASLIEENSVTRMIDDSQAQIGAKYNGYHNPNGRTNNSNYNNNRSGYVVANNNNKNGLVAKQQCNVVGGGASIDHNGSSVVRTKGSNGFVSSQQVVRPVSQQQQQQQQQQTVSQQQVQMQQSRRSGKRSFRRGAVVVSNNGLNEIGAGDAPLPPNLDMGEACKKIESLKLQ